MARKLLYSERKQIAETGSLGPLTDAPKPALRRALIHLVAEGQNSEVGSSFRAGLNRMGVRYLGWGPSGSAEIALLQVHGETFLDLVEVILNESLAKHRVYRPNQKMKFASAIPAVDQELNDLFDRHRFGYRVEDGEIRKISSPALDEAVVGPALLAVRRPGWEEAERRFKEAIHHQRGGSDENDDALTAANAALESAMKAAGLKGDRLSTLAKSFRNSDYAPSELQNVPEALDMLLKRSGAIRDNHSDSHGKGPGADPVPQALVGLAIHWAGAFIVYLSQTVPGQS